MSENVVMKKKDNTLDKLKFFTDLLFDKNYSIERLTKYENDNDFSNFKYRIINLLANHPKLLWYINTHFNNYSSFNLSNMSNVQWFDSLRTIIHAYGITSKNSFRFFKFKVPQRASFKSSLSDTYEFLNSNDLNELYRLYDIKILNNIDSVKLSEKIVKTNAIESNNVKKKETIITKHDFNSKIQAILETKPVCKKCKFFKSDKLFIDGNTNSLDNINILFINDFSSTDDFNRSRIFFDDNKLNSVKYLIMNVLPCNINNDFSNFKKIAEDCRSLTSNIIDTIKCDLKVLIGPRVREWYKIKVKSNSKFINEFSGKFFLLASPEESPDKFEEGFAKLLSIVKSRFGGLTSYENTIKKENPNLTLFDIKTIKNSLLYIFHDENGKKQYFIENIEFPVYIKNGNYRDCNYIEDSVDGVTYLTAFEKGQLSGAYSKNLNQLIKLGY